MATRDACDAWDHGDCEGTPYCPPRCPRFVDREGTPLLVVEFGDGDLDSLLEMYRGYDAHHRTMGLPPVGESELQAWLDSLVGRGTSLLAWADDRVVGHAAFVPLQGGDAEFVVFVDPDWHGRGIGSELTRQAIAHAAAAGHDGLVLDVTKSNGAAVAIYERLGFEVVRDDGFEQGMRLPLSSPPGDAVQLPPAESPA